MASTVDHNARSRKTLEIVNTQCDCGCGCTPDPLCECGCGCALSASRPADQAPSQERRQQGSG